MRAAEQGEERAAVLQVDEKDVGRIVFTVQTRQPGAFVERVFMDGVRSTLLLVSLAAILLLSAISWLVSRAIARPLESASLAAARIAGGELGVRLETVGRGSPLGFAGGFGFSSELTALAGSFNGMADSLQKKEHLRTRMTSDIAHELRTPVSVLKAHLEGLRDGVLSINTDELSSLIDETMRLEKIINDLRSIWELENTGIPLQATRLQLGPFVQTVADRFRPLAEEKGMRLVLAFAEPDLAAAHVRADSSALHRVFDNLMQNALKYGRKNGGKIELAVRRDREETGAERICISVGDDGPGISDEALPLVFERFYRADEARARKTGGAGLGLAIAREAVEACGGSIAASNRGTDAGAVFSVFLRGA
jgi:signal transduction histidine kinase